MDSEIWNEVLRILLPSLATLLAGWFAILGNKIKIAYEEKVNTQIKKEVVQATVEYVEQVYKALKGDEKLEKAAEKASFILNDKGINITGAELRMLIESAVYGLNQGFSGTHPELPSPPSQEAPATEEEE